MSEPNDTAPSAPTEPEEDKVTETANPAPDAAAPDAQDPDDEATVIEPPDPGFVAPTE